MQTEFLKIFRRQQLLHATGRNRWNSNAVTGTLQICECHVHCCLLPLIDVKSEVIRKPNIVFILADDLGWNDVSFHGSDQIMTPNIDVLAYKGIICEEYYTDTQGTPSRSALFTGKYPLRLGTQGASIKPSEDRGIPISERLLPAYLRELGYETHLIGKWHVGKSREHYLPTYRGFDTFYGFLGGSVDYFTYNLVEEWNETSFFGLDLFENLNPVDDRTGHLTNVLTDRAVRLIRNHNTSVPLYLHVSHAAPHSGGGLVNLQPPVDTIEANNHIAHSARRLYAGLVTGLDKSLGQIVTALAETDMLKNTLIVFVSDNGAPTTGLTQNFGSNLPFRGIKNTPWEGAARSVAVIWHAAVTPRTLKGLFHVTDWLPTLVAAAGGNVKGIDGINQWDAITNDKRSKRKSVLITIDDVRGWAAYREREFKMIVGLIDENLSTYQGMELEKTRHDTPNYETTLLESETCRVFREMLNSGLDIDKVFEQRKNSNLLTKQLPMRDVKPCVPTKAKGCLYNITADPLETNDLWLSSPEIVRQFTLRLRTLWAELKPRRLPPKRDPNANPALRNYSWYPWVQNEELILEPLETIPDFPLQVSINELQYLVDLNLNTFRTKIFESLKSMGESFIKTVGSLFSF